MEVNDFGQAVESRSAQVRCWHQEAGVAPAEGLLTEAVLKHVCVLPNRRLFGVASRNSQDGSKNRGGHNRQSRETQDQRY